MAVDAGVTHETRQPGPNPRDHENDDLVAFPFLLQGGFPQVVLQAFRQPGFEDAAILSR